MIARLIVSYVLVGPEQQGTIAVEIPGYEFMAAQAILDRINEEISEQYVRPVLSMIKITNIVELQPRKETALTAMMIDKGYSCSCLACGKENGHGGLPCPTMKPS